MKWTKRGKEYDEEYLDFTMKDGTAKQIFVWGAGVNGGVTARAFKALEIQITFIDISVLKQQEGFCGYEVIAPNEFFAKKADALVLVAATPENTEYIMNQLEENGYVKGRNCFKADLFLQSKLPVYALYHYNKMYIDSIGVLPTTVCNLRCDGCLGFMPQNKRQNHRPMEMVQKDLEQFFKVFDYVNLFNYSGGDPLLYPQTEEMLEYIGENYMDQIGLLIISTNGTIIPSDRLCEIFAKYHYMIAVDDYSEFVDRSKTTVPQIIEKLKHYNVNHTHNDGRKSYWIDLAPYDTDNSKMSEQELIDYHERCNAPYIELRGEKLYSCAYASYATKAGILEEEENDRFSLEGFTADKKKELVEFITGYTDKGYVEFCKRCAGFLTINPYRKPVGRQLTER